MKAILVHQPGGPEAMVLSDCPAPQPGPDQALVKIAYSGVNFIDIYFRIGLYKAETPYGLGMEAAGTVEAVGANVKDLKPGDRVAYAMNRGSYAEYAVVPAWQLVKVPEKLGFDQAAAAMLQGMTAHYLTHSTWPLKQHETCLVHAAAGGAGRLIVQMAKMRGARVIGTTSTEAKAEVAREAGCDEVILYTEKPFDEEVKRLTNGRGVDVVYDSVGKSTFEQSLNSLRPRGLMVTFGNASGAVPAIEPLLLNNKGSLFLTRPTLAHHAATREELSWRAGDVLGWVASGALKLHIEKIYPMSEAAQAQIDLAGRKTIGKLLLDPAR
ncbi:MAG: quinone oxidoreductase [Bryobacterales bacterium]|nr:quinone oxidoreductase [Bryobacterales bacterium]